MGKSGMGDTGGDTTYLAVVRSPRARHAATVALAAGLNLFLGYLGNGALQQPWRLLEVWVLPEHGWAPAPAPTETDDGMGPDIAATVLITLPFLLLCAFVNYLVTQAVNVHRRWYAFIAAVALLAPTVAFEMDPLMYAEIPRP
ncbi:hypothetical protein [Streptomyces sp. NPDC050538]|uniref:hypothetical protein n=1 Tax=Streptomyces sp. NPDC050538 TaxID=3365627 RepID=UPI0037BC6D9C